ncbi:MAG: FMN-binding negative transcriptional regulator [Pseudomonadota bacterium]|nr:FMN-binding negative transcriptional regulator [Pseudomonadota bacterium]
MSLYTPRHFLGSDAQALRLIHDNPFATVITTVDGAEPHITHIPLLLEDGAIVGHLARANPHWQAFAQGRTVAVFHGPHSYISPRWYVEPDKNVPTWNYAVAHVHGCPQMLDAADVPQHITALTAAYEQGAWSATPEKLKQLAPGVVGFRMAIERIEVKIKMNQNRSAADRAKVVATLHASGRPDDAAVAQWIVVDE